MPSTFPCPKCGEYHYHKSHTRNIYERLRKIMLNQRQYRCHRCGYRGWERRISIGERLTIKKLVYYLVIFIVAIVVSMICKSLFM